tara:strand:+ start:124 stop:522 length:399 start_codon:yes stop_codon:yes gene_type:complete
MRENNIICVNLSGFETYKEFSKFIEKHDRLKAIRTNSNISHTLSYESVFNKLSKIWILDDFIIYIQHKGSNKMIINPDLEKIILEKSVSLTEKSKVKNIEITLDMDSILDRINDVGVDGLTLEEKDFLDKQN